ncbi:hypothetical protein Pmar_PMAR014867, partial [Perkinsus marinus ATCC 50983]
LQSFPQRLSGSGVHRSVSRVELVRGEHGMGVRMDSSGGAFARSSPVHLWSSCSVSGGNFQ